MQKYIDELRRKPKPVRSQFALLGAGLFTSVLFVGWLFSLGNLLEVESADPAIARYNREMAEKEAAEGQLTDTTVGSMFSQFRRGAAALIFSDSAEIEEKPPETKNIDIDALLVAPRQKKPAPTPTEEEIPTSENDAEPMVSSESDTGQVILIGTSTAQTGQPEQ